jgi:YHS domain-containing protein
VGNWVREFLKKPVYLGALLVIWAAVSLLAGSWYNFRTLSGASERRILHYADSLNPEFPIDMPPTINVPVDAVIDLGLYQTGFVDRGKGYFEPRRVKIVEGLRPGECIVVSGNFLIDSDSRMQVAATGFSGKVVKDPVCGGDVNEGKARSAGLKSEYQGLTHYFCSYSCNKQFDQDPERYLAKTPAGSGHGVAPPLTTLSAAAPTAAATPTAPTAMSKDPICNLEVDEAKATAAGLVSEYQGKTYFFDSIQCKQYFDKKPKDYVGKGAGQKKPGVPVSGAKTLPPGLAKDPVSGLNVDERKAKAVGLVSEYREKTYFFFQYPFQEKL